MPPSDERTAGVVPLNANPDWRETASCACSGRILYLTGGVDERTIEKFEREAKEKNRDSWYMAYIMDTNEEERAKGKTVEVGRALFSTAKRRYTILDAPGHKNYVPNMIAGATQADCGVMVRPGIDCVTGLARALGLIKHTCKDSMTHTAHAVVCATYHVLCHSIAT